jgi:hypothetical protein
MHVDVSVDRRVHCAIGPPRRLAPGIARGGETGPESQRHRDGKER